MAPGVYFRSLLIGYFEGLDSERGIAWRTADSLSLPKFLGYALDEATPDHSTISRTRRLY
jgi:transposase